MLIIVDRKKFILGFLCLLIIIISLTFMVFRVVTETKGQAVSGKYRVFVSGTGTVEGAWSGSIGIAVIGVATKAAPEPDKELKVIDVLITNAGNDSINFNPDFILVNKQGEEYILTPDGQPEVIIKPGTMSQGTVIIDVPRGTTDEDLTFEVKGGCFPTGIKLPLKVQKITQD